MDEVTRAHRRIDALHGEIQELKRLREKDEERLSAIVENINLLRGDAQRKQSGVKEAA